MAEGLNKVMLLGNLGADPELRMTQGGQGILKLRLATTETYLDRNNTRQERTEWHQVTVWGKRGEALSREIDSGPGALFTEEEREVIALEALSRAGRRDEVRSRGERFLSSTPRSLYAPRVRRLVRDASGI